MAGTTWWTWLSYAYGALVVIGLGYFLFDLPVQVSDSYGNIVQASRATVGQLVYAQFHSHAYLRPFLWALIRIVYDLSSGHYFEWFRGWHVGQVTLLIVLFLRLVRPQSVFDAAAVPLGLASLIGIHTFADTVKEAFPINTYMTILLCCFLAADLTLGPPRWWRDVSAAALFVFSALSVESGLLVAVVFVAAYAAGARGVSLRGLVSVVALAAGYFLLRFGVFDVGTPDLTERSSGFGFSTREPAELVTMFGGRVLVFYAYNAVTSFLSVLLSEPRGGVWIATRGIVQGDPSVASIVNIIASLLALVAIVSFVWFRRSEWRARRFNRRDQLVIVFIAVLLANAAISYVYTKDVILSPAGAFFAVALTVATTDLLERTSGTTTLRRGVAALLVCALSSAWAFRAVGIHVGLRHAGVVVRNDWAYVDDWLEQQNLVPTQPATIELKQHLQHDAIVAHPARPIVLGHWLKWFEDE
ncbi:MAG TPA: hypothetical protein VGF24_07930 [Vicinamibacterales bacterium]|jgi:hypothetical protein